MGAFHISCAFLAVIGKRFGNAGLQYLLVENGVIGSSAVERLLSGKQYINRSLHVHKLKLRWQACESRMIHSHDDNGIYTSAASTK